MVPEIIPSQILRREALHSHSSSCGGATGRAGIRMESSRTPGISPASCCKIGETAKAFRTKRGVRSAKLNAGELESGIVLPRKRRWLQQSPPPCNPLSSPLTIRTGSQLDVWDV
jgi:hypothetical protein